MHFALEATTGAVQAWCRSCCATLRWTPRAWARAGRRWLRCTPCASRRRSTAAEQGSGCECVQRAWASTGWWLAKLHGLCEPGGAWQLSRHRRCGVQRVARALAGRALAAVRAAAHGLAVAELPGPASLEAARLMRGRVEGRMLHNGSAGSVLGRAWLLLNKHGLLLRHVTERG